MKAMDEHDNWRYENLLELPRNSQASDGMQNKNIFMKKRDNDVVSVGQVPRSERSNSMLASDVETDNRFEQAALQLLT
jgi:hypothetical protein